MKFLWRRLLGFLSAAAALVGCDEGPASNVSFTSTPDVWSFVTAAATGGPLFVEVHGNPFQQPKELVSKEITAAIASTFTEPWLHFTDAKQQTGAPTVRLIWLLGAGSGFNADLVCAGTLPSLESDRRVTEIRAVFCQRERPLSAVHGWMRRPDTPADPRWRQLMQQMSRQLLRGRG